MANGDGSSPVAASKPPRVLQWLANLVALVIAAWLVSIVTSPIHALLTPHSPRPTPHPQAQSTNRPPSASCIESVAKEAWAEITKPCRDYGDELRAVWLSDAGLALQEKHLVADQIRYCTEHPENTTWLCSSWDDYFPSGRPNP